MADLMRLLVDRMRMLKEDALAVSKVVEDAFHGNTELDDELLDKDLRQVFYSLQDEKVLDVRREERREDGVDRRHYIWHLRELDADGLEPARRERDPDARVYERLGDNAWERRPPTGST
jgi:hypothetical protein